MRVLLAALAVSTVVALSGCNEGTPGGPGASTQTDSTNTTVTTDADKEMPSTTDTDATDPAPLNSNTNTTGETPATAATDRTPTTTTNPASDGIGDPNNTFRLDMPNLTTTLKQGESIVISVGISREDNFDEDVKLEFRDLPKGVTIEPESPVLKAGDKEAKITIKAAEDAALNDYTINVLGHPKTGKAATNKLNISVEQP